MVKLVMAAAALGAVLLSGGAGAQGVTDPGDLAFWQSIQNSTNPAEYRAYLEAYPDGRFAALARIRAAGGGAPATAPASAPASAPVAAPDTQAPDDYRIGIAPAAARVGQVLKIDCGNIPTGNTYDTFIVVPAGTPEVAVSSAGSDQVLWWHYTNYGCGAMTTGPFAPGAYELRWTTILFNNDRPPRYETKARARFSVR